MKQIGFTNFRKFEEFPSIDLGDITMLVGRNSSGKSTMVKALLLALDNLREMPVNAQYPYKHIVRFDKNQFSDLNISTFHRALNTTAKAKGENTMSFKTQIGYITYEIKVSGNPEENNGYGFLTNLIITASPFRFNAKYEFEIDFVNDTRTFRKYDDKKNEISEQVLKRIEDLFARLEALKKECDLKGENYSSAVMEQIEVTAELNALKAKLESIEATTAISSEVVIPFIHDEEVEGLDFISEQLSRTIEDCFDFELENKYGNLDEGDAYIDEKTGRVCTIDDDEWIEYKSQRDILLSSENDIMDIAHSIRKGLGQAFFGYIYAHGVNQRSIYSIHDKNDYIAKTLHDYNKVASPMAEDFIRTWMREFEIGDNFILSNYFDEGYSVQIEKLSKDGEIEQSVGLADLGMGSIQVMIILFRLASMISYYTAWDIPEPDGKIVLPTIIIEEPEQNLHPALQSKLAELFYQVNSDYGFRFIIETHSEYLIRKTQVEVAKHKGEEWENPFAVYYFPVVGNPYKMEYRADGKFSNEFGKGFFDEAAELAFQIF